MAESYIEKLPMFLEKDGQKYYLRIKQHNGYKKWNIRYLGEKPPDERKMKFSKDYRFKVGVRGYTYKVYKMWWGHTLENLAKKVLKDLDLLTKKP